MKMGNVGYAGWKLTPGDIEALDAYLNALSRANPALDAGREARLAFWINAYNALTIRGILREYPTMSIQDHAPRSSGYNIWRDLLLHVGEHGLIRWARSNTNCSGRSVKAAHSFLQSCAGRAWLSPAVVAPALNRAYQSSDLEQQLGENSRNFFADPQKLGYDSATGKLRLSPILKWYADDFGESQTEMLESIIPYLPDRVTAGNCPTNDRLTCPDFLDYDWSLRRSGP